MCDCWRHMHKPPLFGFAQMPAQRKVSDEAHPFTISRMSLYRMCLDFFWSTENDFCCCFWTWNDSSPTLLLHPRLFSAASQPDQTLDYLGSGGDLRTRKIRIKDSTEQGPSVPYLPSSLPSSVLPLIKSRWGDRVECEVSENQNLVWSGSWLLRHLHVLLQTSSIVTIHDQDPASPFEHWERGG